jgi:hypothetical protein
MRLQFANFVQFVLHDQQTAALVRRDLMTEWTDDLMRILMVEMWTQQGWEVTWEYVAQDEGQGTTNEGQSGGHGNGSA